jgi:hypothetical protein
MIFFHGSNSNFKTFSTRRLVREGSGANSALGIWLGEAWVANNFGKYLYEVSCAFKSYYSMDVSTMFAHHNSSGGDPDYFKAMRWEFRDQDYDAIFLIEADGSHPTVVSLDPKNLTILSKTVR